MNYFKTNMDATTCRALIKSLRAHDYEFCIVALKNNASIVISNCQKLDDKIKSHADFEDIGIYQNSICDIHHSGEYKTTHGNHGLFIDSLS